MHCNKIEINSYRDRDIEYMTNTQWLVEIYNDTAHNTSMCKLSVNNPGSKILVIKYAIKITRKTILDKILKV